MKWSISHSTEGLLLERDGVTLLVPATLAGIKVLQEVLFNLPSSRIGEPGFPTQTQLNEMVRKWKEKHPPQFPIDLGEIGL